MRATVGEDAAVAIVVGTAAPLLSYRFWSSPRTNRTWDISPDGDRFLMIAFDQDIKTDTAESRPQIIVVQNWFEELKRLVPTD